MKVSQFAHLVDLWKLVEKDPSVKYVVLHRQGIAITGMHVSAWRRHPLPLEEPIAVFGDKLIGALALFPDRAELTLKDTGRSLVLTAKGRRAMLVRIAEHPPLKIPRVQGSYKSVKTLQNVIPFLRACTAGGVQQPILTGIHFRSSPSRPQIVLESTDSAVRAGRVKLKSPLPCTGEAVPAADLEQALALMKRKVALTFTKGHMLLADGITTIQVSLLAGKYPNLDRLPAAKTYSHQIVLKKGQMDTAIKAAILLDDARLITFRIKDGKAAWIIRAAEAGGFREPLGSVDLEDVEIIFDAHWLDAAQYLGREFTLHYDDGKRWVVFTGSGGSLWMSPVQKVLPEVEEVEE